MKQGSLLPPTTLFFATFGKLLKVFWTKVNLQTLLNLIVLRDSLLNVLGYSYAEIMLSL